MARFIFVEIEGVLVHEISRRTAILLNEDVKAFKPSIDALDRIVSYTGGTLIVTSRWRAMGLGMMQDRFRAWGSKSTVVDVTPQDIDKDVAVRHFLRCAKEWGYGSPTPAIVILDHEKVYGDHLTPYLVKTNSLHGGLTNALADEAIAILDKKIYAPE